MHTIKKIFYILCILAIMFAFFCIIHCVLNWYNAKNQSNLLNEIIINQNVESNQIIENIYSNEHFQDLGNSESENIITERMLKVQELKKQNEDIVAWLEIEGTKINYPVLQYTDNSFYMNHDYKKSYSSSGSIYLDKDYNFDEKSANLLIYGHNMKNGTMFRDLLKYSDKAFYDSHPTIRFTTTNEDSVFEIISVFKSRVYYKSEENVFRYYYFVNAETLLYIIFQKLQNIPIRSLHFLLVPIIQQIGRFVVVARKKNT